MPWIGATGHAWSSGAPATRIAVAGPRTFVTNRAMNRCRRASQPKARVPHRVRVSSKVPWVRACTRAARVTPAIPRSRTTGSSCPVASGTIITPTALPDVPRAGRATGTLAGRTAGTG